LADLWGILHIHSPVSPKSDRIVIHYHTTLQDGIVKKFQLHPAYITSNSHELLDREQLHQSPPASTKHTHKRPVAVAHVVVRGCMLLT